jgi:hypothetical protein
MVAVRDIADLHLVELGIPKTELPEFRLPKWL